MSGRDLLEESISALEAAASLWGQMGRLVEANTLATIRALLPLIFRRSTWHQLGEFFDHPLWRRYLLLLARGTDQDILRSAAVAELWPSQTRAIEAGLLTSTSSLVIRMPTSSGKTRSAELAIVAELIRAPGLKCIYLAPYRALVSEVEGSYSRVFPDLGFRLVSSTGAYEPQELEIAAVGEADVMVMTPERLDLILRTAPELASQVSLIVVDEAHVVGDGARGVKLDFLITRIKTKFPNTRLVLMSAVVPDQTLRDFARWLGREEGPADVASSDWRPTVLRHASFEWNGATGVLRYERAEEAAALTEFVPGIVRVEELSFINPRTGRRNREPFPDGTTKAQTAAALAFALAPSGPVLVFCTTKPNVDAVGQAMLRRLELAALRGEQEPRLPKAGVLRSLPVAEEWLGAGHRVCHLLREGIAVHHGGLPDPVRNAIEDDMRERRLSVLIATNTLAQGVNLPLRTVIFHTAVRYSGDKMTRIPARDYWNIAGRAGRARHETDGLVVHIVHSPRDRDDVEFYGERRNAPEPVESAVYSLLRELAQDRISPEAAATGLDAEILALLVEEGADDEALQRIERVALSSLGAVQAQGHPEYLDSMRGLVAWTTNSITTMVPDPNVRTIYSRTGLTTESCRILDEFVAANQEHVRRLALSAGPGDVGELLTVALGALATVPQLVVDDFAADPVRVATLWVEGRDLGAIRADVGAAAGSPERLAGFVENYCGYLAPWGVGSLTRIATASLGLDEMEISPYVRYLASMLRFGVPSPESAWAMALGIPARRTAIDIAARFIRSYEERSPASLRQWFAEFEFGEFANIDVPASLIEQTGLAILRAGSNPRLAAFEGVDQVLPLTIPVRLGTAGIQLGLGVELQAEVLLERDYDSILDRNAITIVQNGTALGQLPRSVGQLLAPELDSGSTFDVRLEVGEADVQAHISRRV